MQEDGHLTTVIRLQIVFVGLPKPNYHVILRDKGRETPFRRSARCFDVSPHGSSASCLLQKLPHMQICDLRLLEMDIRLKTMNIGYILQTYRRPPLGLELSVCIDLLGENCVWSVD